MGCCDAGVLAEPQRASGRLWRRWQCLEGRLGPPAAEEFLGIGQGAEYRDGDEQRARSGLKAQFGPQWEGKLTLVPPITATKEGRIARRIGAWVLWWVLLMSFWVILDDSLNADELLAGAAAAAFGAFFAELAAYQAVCQVRLRIEWLAPALSLPWELLRDTGVIFLALLRRLVSGEAPASGFREEHVRFGSDSAEGKTRRSLLIGGLSVAPNRFVLGLDRQSGVMVVHELVTDEQEAGE